MDINAAIDQLGLNANNYKLTQSVPPHTIVEWNGPDAQPTQAELDDYHEDVKIEAVLSGFVRLCSEYGFYFMMRQLTKALNAKGFNV